MLPGDFILEPPGDRFGSLVAAVSQGRYCHVRLIADDAAASAEEDGVVWEDSFFEGDLAVSPPLTDEQRAGIQSAVQPLIGKPYSTFGMLAVGLARLGLRLPWLDRPLGDPPAVICSQLVVLAWRRVGFDPFPGRQPQDVTPGDLADVAFREGWPVYTP